MKIKELLDKLMVSRRPSVPARQYVDYNLESGEKEKKIRVYYSIPIINTRIEGELLALDSIRVKLGDFGKGRLLIVIELISSKLRRRE